MEIKPVAAGAVAGKNTDANPTEDTSVTPALTTEDGDTLGAMKSTANPVVSPAALRMAIVQLKASFWRTVFTTP